jgi:hypothetical protein
MTEILSETLTYAEIKSVNISVACMAAAHIISILFLLTNQIFMYHTTRQ